MNELVAFYVDKPVELKGRVEVEQSPIASSASRIRSLDGAVRSSLVYVKRRSEAGPFLVPFGEFDEWSLRDRYNEAIRIMNTLGASSITCETFRDRTARRRVFGRIARRGGQLAQQRDENSGFDFHHMGAGSSPRDPRPLRWPEEPGFTAAVSSVLDNGATQVAISIKSHQRYALEGDLALRLRGVGFELGASSERSKATSLHIRAEFPVVKRMWK